MIASRGGMHTYDVIMYRPLRTGHCVDMTVTFLNGGQYGNRSDIGCGYSPVPLLRVIPHTIPEGQHHPRGTGLDIPNLSGPTLLATYKASSRFHTR